MPGQASMAFLTRRLILSPFPLWLVSIKRFPIGHRAEAMPPVVCHTHFPQELGCSLWEQDRQVETRFLRQGPNNSRTDLIPHTKKGTSRNALSFKSQRDGLIQRD